MKKSEENKKLKEETLLSSAFNLFTKKGFKETSIQDIAEKVGYDSTDYFTRLFKKTYHILPSQYRKNQKNACKK